MNQEQLRLAITSGLDDGLKLADPKAARMLQLRRMDASTRTVIEARTAAAWQPSGGYSIPRSFLCSDDGIWWLKSKAQQGLLVEVVAGRLAHLLGCGPLAAPIHVGTDAIAGQLGLLRFAGHVAGVAHRAGVESSKSLARLGIVAGDHIPVDERSRASVVVFQTWLDVSDPQVLVNLMSGVVESHDHGDTFGELRKGPPSRVVIARIPGVPDHLGLTRDNLDAAIRRIEGLSDAEILWAVAQVPDEEGWRAPFPRRIAIAEWLIKRRPRLREVLLGWGRLPT